jgi:hypothetical protein
VPVDAAGRAGPFGPPEPEHDPERVRELADEILWRPEYRWDDPTQDPIGRAVDWLGERIGDVLSAVGAGGSLSVSVAWAVLVGLVVVGALLIWRSRGSWGRARQATGPGARVVVGADGVPVDWADEAERARAEGRWRDALRCGYRALVVDLAAAGALGDLVGRTTGELAGELSTTRPAAAGRFAAATELFEATWYGGAPTGPGDLDRLARLAADVRERAAGQVAP